MESIRGIIGRSAAAVCRASATRPVPCRRQPASAGRVRLHVCHDGQGSATDFRWASHTPNDSAQRRYWRTNSAGRPIRTGIFPCSPRRFQQSRCLPCHPNVTDLELVGGDSSRRRNGKTLDNRRQESPPTAPPAEKLVAGYESRAAIRLFRLPRDTGVSTMSTTRLGQACETSPANSTRTISPSGFAIRPRFCRPRECRGCSGCGNISTVEPWPRRSRSEEAEIAAVVEYLLASAKPVRTAARRQVSRNRLRPSVASGYSRPKAAWPAIGTGIFRKGKPPKGPICTNVGEKYLATTGIAWLIGWLRDPARYSPQTLMPNPLLEPTHSEDGGKTSDPAADLAAYLMRGERRGKRGEGRGERADKPARNVRYLVKPTRCNGWAYLSGANFLVKAIASLSSSLPSPRSPLLSPLSSRPSDLGRRTIAKRGCAGCHDIPGFEAAAPIGPSLSDLGPKAGIDAGVRAIDEFCQNRRAGAAVE